MQLQSNFSTQYTDCLCLQQRIQALMGSMTSADNQSAGLTASKVGSMVYMQSEEIKKASDEYAQKVCLWQHDVSVAA